MDFQITAEAKELQARARRLAEDFATRRRTSPPGGGLRHQGGHA